MQSFSSEHPCTPGFGIIASHLSWVWVLKSCRAGFLKKAGLKLSAREEKREGQIALTLEPVGQLVCNWIGMQ